MASDVDCFAVVCFVNPKGSGSINPKGLFVTNVLNSSFNLGSNTSETGWVDGFVIDSLMFQVCWYLQVSSRQAYLWTGLSYFPFQFLWLISECFARKSSYACCFVQGVDTVLAVDPFTYFKTLFDSYECWLHIFFCNLVSCSYACSLGCVCVLVFVLLGLTRVDHMVCFITLYPRLGCTWVRSNVPPIFVSFYFYL